MAKKPADNTRLLGNRYASDQNLTHDFQACKMPILSLKKLILHGKFVTHYYWKAVNFSSMIFQDANNSGPRDSQSLNTDDYQNLYTHLQKEYTELQRAYQLLQTRVEPSGQGELDVPRKLC